MHNDVKKNTIRRGDFDELDEELRPKVDDDSDVDRPCGSPHVNERFVAFGGNPRMLNDVGSVASAGLVIAEQISELTDAVRLLAFLVTKLDDE